jgi:hypothetical protein
MFSKIKARFYSNNVKPNISLNSKKETKPAFTPEEDFEIINIESKEMAIAMWILHSYK